MGRKFLFFGLILIVISIIGFLFIVNNKPSNNKSSSEEIEILDNKPNSICQKITSAESRFSCLAFVNKDETFCNRIDGDGKNICLAAVKNDSKFCQEISNKNRQSCYQNLVSVTGKSDFCSGMTEKKDISSCYVHFVSTNFLASNFDLLNQKLCEQIIDNSPEKTLCLAMVNQNPNVCGPERNDCAAFFSKDESICIKSASEIDKAECYHALAMLTNNSSICEKIIDSNQKDDCYKDYGRISENTIICGRISNVMLKGECYKNVAIHLVN